MDTEAVSERGRERDQRGGGGRRGREERGRAEASGSREAIGLERPWFCFLLCLCSVKGPAGVEGVDELGEVDWQ
jgi:hypothetical protein